jgi:hypothetical protein
LEIKYAGRTTWNAEIHLDRGRGFNDLEKITIPTSPTEMAFTYTFPLSDAPLSRIRLDPTLSNPAEATITHFRIINRRGEEICHFIPKLTADNTADQVVIIGSPGWELTANAEDQRILLHFTRPLIPEGMNERNLKRCLLSTGSLVGMLQILLLAIYFTFTRPSSWRTFFISAGFLLFLSAIFSSVGNRGLIKNSLAYARVAAALTSATESDIAPGPPPQSKALLEAGAHSTGGVLGTGWHSQEGGARWIARQAYATFKSGNSGKILIKGFIPELTSPNRITLRANGAEIYAKDHPLGSFMIECSAEPHALTSFAIELQNAFVPKEKGLNDDIRELGVIITDVFIH